LADSIAGCSRTSLFYSSPDSTYPYSHAAADGNGVAYGNEYNASLAYRYTIGFAIGDFISNLNANANFNAAASYLDAAAHLASRRGACAGE
jgi:hypothetical protein